MVIASPKHRLSLWLLANLAWVALVPAAALYFHRQLLNGAYPPEADSIGLPIMGIAMWVIALLLPLNLLWWFLLRRYPGRVPLWSSGSRKGVGCQVIGVVGVICGITFVVAALIATREDAWEVAPIFAVWSYLSLAMRAVFLTSRQSSSQSKA
jgi:hypothetical protein